MIKKRGVSIGRIYASRIDGRIVPVRILYGIERFGKPMRWIAENIETDEEIEIRSAVSLRYGMVQDADGTLRRA